MIYVLYIIVHRVCRLERVDGRKDFAVKTHDIVNFVCGFYLLYRFGKFLAEEIGSPFKLYGRKIFGKSVSSMYDSNKLCCVCLPVKQ